MVKLGFGLFCTFHMLLVVCVIDTDGIHANLHFALMPIIVHSSISQNTLDSEA